MQKKNRLKPVSDRGPLRTMFAVTSLPVGGAETLLLNLVRRLDRERILPEICCLKEKGELGELLSGEIPVHHRLLAGKFDLRIVWRLFRLFKERRTDALVTVGAGDKMFWGRVAGRFAGLPVITSALHSTGWPDSVGRANRILTPITDAFIAVANEHQRFLIGHENLPPDHVRVIHNGVDTERFRRVVDVGAIRQELGIPTAAPVVGIVAALRPEKNHRLFLEMAKRVLRQVSEAHFLIIGDGPERSHLEWLARELGVANQTRFCGTRQDIPALLSTMNAFALSSDNEANPVSILEAMSIGLPVVSTNVGSIHESVKDGETGFLVPPGDAETHAALVGRLLLDPVLAREFGERGRQAVVENWSLDAMVRGYEDLITGIYTQKAEGKPSTTYDALPTGCTARYDAVASPPLAGTSNVDR